MEKRFFVHPDITVAETLPASFYRDPDIFEAMKDLIFARSWQWIGDDKLVELPQFVHPFVLLEHFLDEPMILARDAEDQLHCLSNVCTHRASLVVQHPGKTRKLQCPYHGRRFQLNGEFEFMPEFKKAKNFPRSCDHLPAFPLQKWGPLLFTSIGPAFDLSKVIEKMNKWIGFLPLHEFYLDAAQSKDYLVHAHWALYCDNYLEGFHIPFVHNDLNNVLDYGTYTTVLDDYFNLQIGYSENAEETFDLPEDHPDYGKNVAAYYFWVFPNMMFNFYPWGLSLNIVRPISLNRTKVSFLSYIYDETKLDSGAGALLDKVEREDEFVVENVHKGLKSRFYHTGRFSPDREQGVHHFHQLLASFVNS